MRWIVALLLAAFAGARAGETAELIPVGKIKAVTFADSRSQAGGYILAWTLLPDSTARAPFDWSGWTASAPTAPLQEIGWEDVEENKGPYRLHDVFIDRARHRWIDLHSEVPSFTRKGFGSPTLWAEPNGDHVIVQNPGHFGSLEIWIVTAGRSLSVQDITEDVHKAVDKLLIAKYGKACGGQTWFAVDSEGKPEGLFSEGAVTIRFDSGTERESTLTGTLTIRLRDGVVISSAANPK